MSMEIVRRIAYERENSQLVPSKPRSELQRVRLNGLYELLVLLRIILVLNLQTGWIHQDEFSNSLEVVAGDYFDLQVFKSPAFNTSFPTHSMALVHTTVYLPYLLCNYFLSYEHPVGKEQIPNSKLLILIPRLFHLLLSFLVDYILIKFCELNDATRIKKSVDEELQLNVNIGARNGAGATTTANNENSGNLSENSQENVDAPPSPSEPPPAPPSPRPSTLIPNNDYSIRLVTLASSQVLLIFATRTHPSSINLLLFALLLYLVSASFHAYEEYIPLLEKYHKIPKTEAVQKVHYLRLLKRTGYSPINRLHWITLITVIGLFNDPEFFISYACIPLFFYMQRGISHRLIGMKYFHARIFTFLLFFFLFSTPLILWDSFYYGKLSLEDFSRLSLTPESFVVTPANYFARKPSQFRDIFAYPKIFFMYILLFNILGVMGLISFVKELHDVFFAEWSRKPNLDSHWTFLNCSLFLPLFFLIQANGNSYSAFDLVPLIFPLVYMHGHKIPLVSRFSNKIGFVWFLSNILGILYFGYAAQGGILTSFLDLYDNLVPIRFNETQIDITFSQMTAIPPTFTLAIPSKWKTLLEMEVDPTTDLGVDIDNLDDDGLGGLPSTLHKTVLKLESSSKVRVYHTGHSPLPMSHLERDLHRLVVAQEGQDNPNQNQNQHQNREKEKEKGRIEKVSFLLIPYSYGRESEETFRLLKLRHVKTYWNHVFFNPFNDDGSLSFNFKERGAIAMGRNVLHVGLSLYRMEKVVYSTSNTKLNNTNTEEKFQRYFHFHDAFYDFVKYAIDFATLFVTSGLFLTSYLVFLT